MRQFNASWKTHGKPAHQRPGEVAWFGTSVAEVGLMTERDLRTSSAH
jgi:hypothetical protein